MAGWPPPFCVDGYRRDFRQRQCEAPDERQNMQTAQHPISGGDPELLRLVAHGLPLEVVAKRATRQAGESAADIREHPTGWARVRRSRLV
jgi:hypothetical protein